MFSDKLHKVRAKPRHAASALALAVVLGGALPGCPSKGTVGPDGAGDGFVPRPDAAPMCTGNNDGVITRDELPVVMGVGVDYLVNPPGTTVSVRPEGTTDGGGNVVWDFTSEQGVVLTLTLVPVWDTWSATHFPEAHYATRLLAESTNQGVYRVDDQAVWLMGFASLEANRTLAVYDPPVPSLRFPVEVGLNWVSVGEIRNAVYDGQPFASTDTYRVSVDMRGTVRLPYLDLLNTLRVKVELTQSLAGGTTLRWIQYVYLHECYGELGRIVSVEGELDPQFDTASEFRRLAL